MGASAAGSDFDLSAVLKLNVTQLQANLAAVNQRIDAFTGRAQSAMSALNSRFQSATQHLAQMANAATRARQVVGRGLDTATKAVTGLAAALGGASIAMTKLASDANEAASKFTFVFGEAADKTGKSLDEFAKAAGRSRYEMRSMAADIGALLGPMGFTKQKTGELSVAVSQLAVDLSSFFNVSESDALTALRAAIVGESEPLRRLGVTLNEAKIQAEAFRLGIAKTKDEVQGATKAQSILSLVFAETKQAQGDAIRTGDQLANSWRRMTSLIKEASTDLGQVFVPTITRYTQVISENVAKVIEWGNVNRAFIAQKFDKYVAKLEAGAINVGKAFVYVYDNSGPVVAVLQDIYDQVVQLYNGFMAWFDTLPEGTQDILKAAAAMTAIGVGLEKIGGSIPIVGQFATAIGNLLNPINAVKGAFDLLVPLISIAGPLATAFVGLVAAGGPITLLIAALGGAAGLTSILGADEKSLTGLADTLKGAFADAFSAAKEAAAAFTEYMNGDALSAIGHVHKAIGDLASAVGMEGLAKELRSFGDSEIMKSKGDQAQHSRNVEKYGETGANALKARSEAQSSAEAERSKLKTMKDSLIKGDVLGLNWAFGKAGLLPSDEDIKAQERRVVEANAKERSATAAATEFERNPAERFKARETDYQKKVDSGEVAKKDAAEEAKAEELARKAISEDTKKKRIEDGGEAFDKNTPNVGKDFWDMVDKSKGGAHAVPGGPVASGAAPAGGQSASAPVDVNENGQPVDFFGRPLNKEADWMKKEKTTPPSQDVLKNGLGNTPFMNLLQNKENTSSALGFQGQEARTAMLGARGTVTGKLSPEEQQGMAALAEFGQQIMQQIKLVSNLEGEEKQKQIKNIDDMQKQFFGLTAAVQNGKMKLSDLANEFQRATKDAQAMNAADEEKILNAQGKLSPRQQQAQQQAQQAAQQMAQGIQQALGMANEQSKAIWNGVFGGAEEVQSMINQAVATGNTKAATDLIRGRVEAQLQQSKQNLHVLSTSTILGNFNADNSAYQMSKDTPIANMIRFLQDQLAKLPRMASGGIVTGATQAVVGEAGPEAILPLSKFGNMLGALPVFQGIQRAVESIGNYFNSVGNAGMANRYFANLGRVQQTYDYAMDRMYNARRVDFTPASMMGGPMAGGGASGAIGLGGRMAYGGGGLPFGAGGPIHFNGGINLNLGGFDFTRPNAAALFAQQLFPALEAEARRRGPSLMGNSVLRNSAAGASRAYGYAR